MNKGSGAVGISIEAITADPRSLCRGTMAHDHATRKLPAVVTSDTGGAQWSWRIPRAVRAGRWDIKVTCDLLTGSRSTTAHFLADGGTGPGKRKELYARHSLQTRRVDTTIGQKPGGSGAGSDASLYPIGNCTWWVAKKRPDLPYFPGRSGDAKNWAKSAALAGWPVRTVPEVGAVAVFQYGQHGADKDGHVAYVEKVEGDKIVVSEAHFGDSRPGSTRRTSWAGIVFVYRKPVSPPVTTTPATPPPTAPTTIPPQSTPTDPPTTPTLPPEIPHVTHYRCEFTGATLNHTVDPGLHWGVPIITQGTTITNGTLFVAAQDDKPDHAVHRATVGIYDDMSMGVTRGTVTVDVPVGGDGIEFTFAHPISVAFNEHLYFAITAIDRLTAYDVDQTATHPADPEGCLIGSLEGTSPPTFSEQVNYAFPARTFTDHRNAGGEGPPIGAGQVVKVFCKVLDTTIPSANPDGYWYRIASEPWRGDYYSPANTFLNGDPPGGPYQHDTDMAVPDCT